MSGRDGYLTGVPVHGATPPDDFVGLARFLTLAMGIMRGWLAPLASDEAKRTSTLVELLGTLYFGTVMRLQTLNATKIHWGAT